MKASRGFERPMEVMVLDTVPSMIEGTKLLLETDGRYAVYGSTDLDQAMNELACRDFDCILVDLSYPKVFDAIRKLSAFNTIILVYTDEDPSPFFNRLVDAGAMGFVNKTSTGEQLLQELNQALRGHSCIPVHLIRELRRMITYIEDEQGEKREEITEREEQILHYLALGYTQREMAEAIFVSQRSIEKTIAELHRKFNTASRKEMLEKARQAKLLPQVTK